jgi:hypothetical protein
VGGGKVSFFAEMNSTRTLFERQRFLEGLRATIFGGRAGAAVVSRSNQIPSSSVSSSMLLLLLLLARLALLAMARLIVRGDGG